MTDPCAAFHPDSVTKLQLFIDRVDNDYQVVEWEGAPGSVELQEVTGVEGAEGSRVIIGGIEQGGYLGVLEVRRKERERRNEFAAAGQKLFNTKY